MFSFIYLGWLMGLEPTTTGISIRDKMEGTREIPATPYMLHLLAALPRRNEWVFPSHTSATAEKHYTVRPLGLLRVHHKRIEGWILEQAGVTFDTKGAPGSVLRVVAAA